MKYFFLFFFVQAEDGIRDYDVTGVQTCALPIYVGYDPENLLHLNISLPATAYPDAESHLSYYDALVQRLETLPGVTAATVASQTPYAPANIRVGISAQSRDEAADVDARPIPEIGRAHV